jgi:hypothetical protein
VLVVIDALDECVDAEVFAGLLKRIWVSDLPKWLGLVVTSRPEYEQGWSTKVVQINAEDNHNRTDISAYLNTALAEQTNLTEELAAMVATLLKLFEALFLHTRFLPDLLQDARQNKLAQQRRGSSSLLSRRKSSSTQVSLTATDLVNLLMGLNGVYTEFFQRLYGATQDTYQRVLAPVADAREPLPLILWMRCFGLETYRGTQSMSDQQATKSFAVIRQQCRYLVMECSGETSGPTVQFVHKSMSDWLGGDEYVVQRAPLELQVSTSGESHLELSKQIAKLTQEKQGLRNARLVASAILLGMVGVIFTRRCHCRLLFDGK